MKKHFSLFLVWFLLNNNLNAQSNYKWTHYWGNNFYYSVAYEGDFVWRGQSFGLCRQNLKTGEVKYYRPNIIQADSLNYFSVNELAIAPDGVKWLLTNRSLVRFDEKNATWQYIKYPNQVTSYTTNQNIRIDKNGNIWLLEGVGYYQNSSELTYKNLRCYSSRENRWIQSIEVNASAFEIDSNAGIWLANQRTIRKFVN